MKKLGVTVIVIIATSLVLWGAPSASADEPTQWSTTSVEDVVAPEEIGKPAKGNPKLGSSLNQLLEAYCSGGVAEAQTFAKTREIVLRDDLVQVEVVVAREAIGDLREAVEAIGGEYQGHYETLFQALVPIGDLESLAERPDVQIIREPQRAIPLEPALAGTVDTEALGPSNASAWHSAGYTGSGVKVGVIDGGFIGYTGLLGTDLPPSVTARDYTGTGVDTDSEHGTACAEVVYDMAPDATMYLSKVNTRVELANAVNDLINDGVDIISMSGGWLLDGPGDGTGYLADIVANARANEIFWATAAGNNAEHCWSGTYNDSGSDTHLWASGQNVNYFGPGDGDVWIIPEGFPIVVGLHWDDWTDVNQDYNLYLLRWTGSTWTEVATSNDPQNGGAGQTPQEFITIDAPYEAFYGVVVTKQSATRDVCLRLNALLDLDERVPERSLMFPADSTDAITVGAVDVSPPYPLEPYSSRGPTFGPGGACSGGSTKPDIAGYANVSTVSYGAGKFNGTSAATPHVSGAAALVKEAYPSYTPAQIQAFLEDRAVELGDPGKDNIYGSGRLYLPTPSPALTVTTNAASLVEENSATLNGTLTNDGGEACQYRFGYSTSQGGPYTYTTWSADTKITGQSFSQSISSLSKGTKYYFIAQAKNSAGTASGSELSFLTKPDAPTGFSATTAGTTQINLSWVKGSGAQKTKIQRKQGGYPANKDDGTQVYFGTATGKSDTGLVPSTTYYYRAWSEVSGSQQWSDNYAQAWATTTGAQPDIPDITVSPPSFDVTLAPDTTQDYTLNIGNVGDATLTYDISDVETTGMTATAGGQKLLSQPGSMVLEVPLERSPVEPLNAPEAGNGWQNIMTDGFEGAFPGIWDVHRSSGYTNAYWGKDGYRANTGLYSAFCAKSGTDGVNPPNDYPNNMKAWMIYGPFSLEDASDAELNFYYWLDSEGGYDFLKWMASTNGTNFYGWKWSGDSGGWVSKSFDLTDVYTLGNLCGESQVWIAFIFESNEIITDNGTFIDDVVLRQYVAGINNPPNTPSNPSPVNHATGVSVDTDLSWTGGDPDAGDTVTYDVYFGTSASPSLASNDQSATTYDPGTLNNNTKYYWNIVATDNHTASTSGPVWDFTTGGAAEDCPWLDEEPKSGTVPPGGEADITVTFDTTGLGSTYTANIIISSNDPDESQVIVPVTLVIPVSPSVSIEPPSRTVSPGGTCDIDVWIDAAGRGLAGIDVAVQYNSDVMTTTVADVEAHNLLGGMEIGPEVTEAAGVGEVAYALASGAAVAGVDASVMTITFTMLPAAEVDVPYSITVSKGALLDDTTGVFGDTETNDGTVTVSTGKGDFDGDGDIDLVDFFLFAAAYGSELGDDNYNPAGDFDDNGVINLVDFFLFAAVYGT